MKKLLAALAVTSCFAVPAHADFYTDSTLNNSLANAVDIDPYFSLGVHADIGDVNGVNTSQIFPWVAIFGQGNDAYDYFSFTSLGGKIIADIDYTYNFPLNQKGFDAEIAIWRDNGNGSYTVLAENDDYQDTLAGAGGSVHRFDSFIQLDNSTAGRYVVGVARYSASASDTGWTGGTIASDRMYGLQISVSPVPEPEGYAMLLAGLGIMGAVARRRKMR